MSPTIYNESIDHLLNIRVFPAMTGPYIALLGGWFYFILAWLVIVAIYFKTESAEMMAMAMLIFGGIGFVWNFPGTHQTNNLSLWGIWTILMIFGLSLIWYKWMGRRE